MVGSLYERDDLRELRDAGFSIFYISINIGGFLGPLLTGILQDRMGFHYGFGAAAVGMAFGLMWYSRGRKNLPHTPAPNPLRPEKVQTAIAVGVLLVLVLGSVIASGALNLENFSRWLLGVVIITVIAYFARLLGSSQVEAANKRYIMAYIPLFLTICMFWAVWFQVYTVATVYFDETVDRTFFGFTVPVSWKDSIQAMWVVLFSGVMAAVWTKMGKRQPKTPLKFALAMLVTGVSYLSFIPYISSGTPMPIIVFMLVLLAITIGELMLSPISLSFSTKIAPSMFKTQMVALNFLALSIGFTLGGVLFKDYYNAQSPLDFYWMLATIGAVTCGILLVLAPVLNRMLKGVD